MTRQRMMASALSAAAVAAAAVTGTATVANAAPAPAPHLGVLGDDIWLVGDNAGCNGAVHVGVTSDPATPGQVTVSLTPEGMRGMGPAWTAHPVCHTTINIGWYDTVAPFYHQIPVPLAMGPTPQAPVITTVHTGQGLNLMGFTTTGGLSKGVSEYVIVP